jgi:DNA (cytosine-5)-methyltransferase 1
MLKRKIHKYGKNIRQPKAAVLRDDPVPYRVTAESKKVVSLFTGAMGLDLGLIEAGLQIAVSQDIDSWCVETIKRNSNHPVVHGDISQLIKSDPSCSFLLNPAGIEATEIFAVVGGPPCQAYSTAGRRMGSQDERGSLYEQFIHVVATLQPRFFVMENVKGLLSMPSIPDKPLSPPLVNEIIRRFEELGYRVVHGLLDAVHYGVPQFRERFIIVGSRDNESVFLPAPSHFQMHQEKTMRWQTIRDAIEDLEEDAGMCAKFSPRILEFLKHVPEGGNWRLLPKEMVKEAMGGAFESGGGKVGFYRRLKYDEPSPTLVTSPIQKATILCHPKKFRPLSVREYMRIQQFPESWNLQGATADCYRQIGNAVPIGLGKAIGSMLISVASGKSIVHVKRTRGTSVHAKMTDMQGRLFGNGELYD